MTNNKEGGIIVILGPTASGKSDLALRLAKLAQGKPFKRAGILGGEIISADSRQVYRGMDVGTGKVAKDAALPVPNSKLKIQNEKFKNKDFYSKGIRHYLIDVASPRKQFTADDFKRLGEKAIKEITAKGKLPIIAGGTGFYIDVLLGRMQVAEVPPNKKLRVKLEKQSAEQLFEHLSALDPQRSKTIDRHNKRRIIRAIEISYKLQATSYKPETYNLKPIAYNVLWFGINPGKEKLAQKIKKRLDERLERGMIEEVINLRQRGISWKRLDGFGLEYRWISRFLKNYKLQIINYKQTSNSKIQTKFKNSEEYKNLLRDIIRYSKRQMTWFKRNREINWINPPTDGQKEAEKLLISKFFQ